MVMPILAIGQTATLKGELYLMCKTNQYKGLTLLQDQMAQSQI